MEVTGKIIQVLPPQDGVGRNGNPWKLQAYVLETLDSFPKKVHFEVFGEDRIASNPCNVGEIVTVSFDIESREFNSRWYTSIRAYRIKQGQTMEVPAQSTMPQPTTQPTTTMPQPTAQPPVSQAPYPSMGGSLANAQTVNGDVSSDLPF